MINNISDMYFYCSISALVGLTIVLVGINMFDVILMNLKWLSLVYSVFYDGTLSDDFHKAFEIKKNNKIVGAIGIVQLIVFFGMLNAIEHTSTKGFIKGFVRGYVGFLFIALPIVVFSVDMINLFISSDILNSIEVYFGFFLHFGFYMADVVMSEGDTTIAMMRFLFVILMDCGNMMIRVIHILDYWTAKRIEEENKYKKD